MQIKSVDDHKHFHRVLGVPDASMGVQGRKTVVLGFDFQTVQSVASRYIDYTSLALEPN